MKWQTGRVETEEGVFEAVAPEILSVSRRTDIPAFYSEWFMNRLRRGCLKWTNPFNGQASYVSFEHAEVIVFWTKNPRPLLRFLPEIEQKKIAFYFQFTLNDYEAEGLEPGLPALEERIKTFQDLSGLIGRDRVVWRFDPLILTSEISLDRLMEKIEGVGDRIATHTRKLVFSFADIGYQKVRANLKRARVEAIPFSPQAMVEMGEKIARLAQKWGIEAASCAQAIDLSRFGISHNRCIDDQLIRKISPGVSEIPWTKDPGQRRDCGCVCSKDIGKYNTCPHLCVYCYANSTESLVRKNYQQADPEAEALVP
jgi:DNA repair photolyase